LRAKRPKTGHQHRCHAECFFLWLVGIAFFHVDMVDMVESPKTDIKQCCAIMTASLSCLHSLAYAGPLQTLGQRESNQAIKQSSNQAIKQAKTIAWGSGVGIIGLSITFCVLWLAVFVFIDFQA
jgi:hypothetical protein